PLLPLLSFSALLLATTAVPAGFDDDWSACRRGSGASAIAGCDAVIGSRRLSSLDLAEAYVRRGALRRNKGDQAGALTDLNEAIRLDPQNVQAFYHRGNTYYDKRDFNRATDDLSRAIALDPNFAPAYFDR